MRFTNKKSFDFVLSTLYLILGARDYLLPFQKTYLPISNKTINNKAVIYNPKEWSGSMQ